MTLLYLGRRLAQAVFVLWAAFTLGYGVLYLLPSDPVEIMLAGGTSGESSATPEQVAALKAEFGLDQPLPVQYAKALWSAAHGDFGHSVQTGASVSDSILEALPETLKLTGLAFVFSLAFGLLVAFGGTYPRWPAVRQAVLAIPPLAVSLPTFWVGLMLVQVVSFQWRLLPAIGNEGFESLVLPSLTLAIPIGALIGQVLARSILTALEEPYVETARAKGAGRARIHLRHVLRNASIPAMTVAAAWAGQLLAGSVVVETVYSRSGIGRLVVDAVGTQDIPLVQGLVVLSAVAFVSVNLLVDLLYPLVDPRVTTSRAGVAA
ncbi:ABC transporter permease [Cryptosporangium japonicum]|uniref:ABC transporter permease n=1 Tax=Cryptosporangium japonicum TaxID=80872 RepID=A0ABN0ULS8_9ACTN